VARQRTVYGREFVPGEAIVRDVLLRVGVGMAGLQRRRLRHTTFIGVTGSGGKTSTKELIDAALASRLSGTKTPGLANRLSAVGRTILRTRPQHDYCVAEVAAWRPGSVAAIAKLLRPQVGVVLDIGIEHFKQFRTREATAAEKVALVTALPPDGLAVLNADDRYAASMADCSPARVVTVGEGPAATFRAEDVRAAWPERLSFTLRVEGRADTVRTRLYGRMWLPGVLSAVAVGLECGIPLEQVLRVIADFEPVTARMSVLQHDGVTFVRDEAKAPAWSLDSLFGFVADAQAARKVIVLGTLSDYAGNASRAYIRAAKRALAVADEVAFVGSHARHVRRVNTGTRPDRLRMFATVREAAEHFRRTLRDGDLVVLKGSNHADHLARIALVHTTDVRCWRVACHRVELCDDCKLLSIPERRH
jgi:UDP-N-acetylmuramoyl-tripeptide--D-alanyl-D-alanine ligase